MVISRASFGMRVYKQHEYSIINKDKGESLCIASWKYQTSDCFTPMKVTVVEFCLPSTHSDNFQIENQFDFEMSSMTRAILSAPPSMSILSIIGFPQGIFKLLDFTFRKVYGIEYIAGVPG